MIPTLVEQVEAYRRCHIEPKTVETLSPYNKRKPGGKEREERRQAIFDLMANGEIWTVQQLKEILGWDTRQISSAIKVLIEHGFVKIVDRARINSCKTCLYQRIK